MIKNKRLFLPSDLLEKIGNYYHVNDAINLATAIGMKMDDLIIPKSPMIKTNDYLNFADSYEKYDHILKLFQPKIDRKTLSYHIKRKEYKILQLFNLKCYPIYTKNHLLEAIRSNNFDVVDQVLYKIIAVSKQDIIDIIVDSIESKSFEVLEFAFSRLDIPKSAIIDSLPFISLNYNIPEIKNIYDFYGIEFNIERSSVLYLSGYASKILCHDNTYCTSPRIIIQCVEHGIHNINSDNDQEFISLIKWAIERINYVKNKNDMSDYSTELFRIVCEYNLQACEWMHKNFKLNRGLEMENNRKKYLYRPRSYDIYRFLVLEGYCVDYPLQIMNGSFEAELWFRTFIDTKITHYTLELLLTYKRFDMFIHLFDRYKKRYDVYADEFYILGNEKIVEFLHSKNEEPCYPTNIMEKKLKESDFGSTKAFYQLFHPEIELTKEIMNWYHNNDSDKFLWAIKTIPICDDHIVNLYYIAICSFDVASVSWLFHHYDCHTLDYSTMIKYCKDDIEMIELINNKFKEHDIFFKFIIN